MPDLDSVETTEDCGCRPTQGKSCNLHGPDPRVSKSDSSPTASEIKPFTLLSAAAGILRLRTWGHPLNADESLDLDRQTLALFEKVKPLVDDRDHLRAALAEIHAALDEEFGVEITDDDRIDRARVAYREANNA